MPKIIKMGNWLVFPDNNKLCLKDDNYFIEPLVMDVLVYFCQHPEQVVSRDQLIEAVWKGRIVGDHAVYRIINKLRQTLARDDSQEYIKTIRKKGYQLVCEVSDPATEFAGQHKKDTNASADNQSQSDSFPTESLTPEVSLKTERRRDGDELLAGDLAKGKRNSSWWRSFKWLLITFVLVLLSFLSVKLYFYYAMTSYYQSTPLITLEGTIRDPSFSPDGDYIAFSYRESSGRDWDIYVESLADGRLYQITDDVTDELSPSWAPNGSQLAILRYDNQRCMIDVVSVSSLLVDKAKAPSSDLITSDTTLKSCSGVLQHNDLVWGSENTYLYYTSAKTKVSPLQVFRLTIQTGKTEQLTNYTQGETRGALNIKLAPDNKRLAILRDVNWRDSRIDIFEFATASFETVRHLKGWNRYFDWSNDGRALIYNRNSKEIDAYDVAMNIEKNIAKSVEAISFPTYSPTKSEIAVVAGRKVVNIVAEPLGTQPRPEEKPLTVISSSSIDDYAEYANTSDDIAFVSRRTGEPQVWIKTTNGRERQLTHFGKSFDIQRIRWSPSDRFLLFIHNNTLYQLSLADHSLQILYQAQSGETIEGESWTQGEEAVLFSSDRSGDWQVYRLSLHSQAERDAVEQLTYKGGYAAFEAPQQAGIYYLKYHTQGLWFRGYESDEEVMIIDNIDVFSWNSLYLRQNNLYYLSDDFPKMSIYRYDLESKERSFVQHYHGSPWLLSISYQADKLLYQSNQQTQSTLIILKP